MNTGCSPLRWLQQHSRGRDRSRGRRCSNGSNKRSCSGNNNNYKAKSLNGTAHSRNYSVNGPPDLNSPLTPVDEETAGAAGSTIVASMLDFNQVDFVNVAPQSLAKDDIHDCLVQRDFLTYKWKDSIRICRVRGLGSVGTNIRTYFRRLADGRTL